MQDYKLATAAPKISSKQSEIRKQQWSQFKFVESKSTKILNKEKIKDLPPLKAQGRKSQKPSPRKPAKQIPVATDIHKRVKSQSNMQIASGNEDDLDFYLKYSHILMQNKGYTPPLKTRVAPDKMTQE